MENIGYLRQLIALADTGNFRKAGQKLGVSHSAVSQSIKRLEDSYGVPLFDRTRGKTVPTAFGERLIASARAAINEMDAASRDIALMEKFEGGRLVVGVDPSVSESLLSIPMARMMNRYPSLQFTVRICNRERWEKRLIQREIDVYFGLQPDREASELRYRKLILQPPGLMCHASHVLAEHDSIRMRDLANHTVIGGDVPDWFLWRILDAYPGEFDSLEALRGTFLTSQDFGLLRQLLLQTNTVAVLPEFVMRHELETGRVKRLTMENWPFDGGTISGVAAWLDERPLPPSAHRLISEVQKILDQSFRAPES
ncbi:LysR family transcriptional regulator [Alisedimentitalea sp. MJ-SS2]|uniref:LysR family transcriptional regulator n=1 Tax=Aliisedimentitalea sp. MJ-SS2 TaxID=3049795 RepID=UPI002908F7E3|nr:LysR family transcriptional regulator [Alisedimentitalea sp. MJ-SS2]MDU8929116.1 LysR family transcriptional regulator [Alisedimentitalea sp. MJ-SS2]